MTSASEGSRAPLAHRRHSSSCLRARKPHTCSLLFYLSIAVGVVRGSFVFTFDGSFCVHVVLNVLAILLSVFTFIHLFIFFLFIMKFFKSSFNNNYMLQEMVRR